MAQKDRLIQPQDSPISSHIPEDATAQAFSEDVDAVLAAWSVQVERGLSAHEARTRLRRFGANKLYRHTTRSAWAILLSQFKSLVVGLLVAAMVLAFVMGDRTEAVAILVVVVINSILGFVTEMNAARSMKALSKLGVTQTRVRRDGQTLTMSAEQLVPGDIVVFEAGDIVTADLRLIEASKLQSDESPLTGESMPVSKHTDTLPVETPLPDRANMLYKGTSITRGSGEGVIIGTGMNTELGEISALVHEAKEEETPLEIQLSELGQRLVGIIILITAIVTVNGVFRGNDLWLMVETGIALAVASIPEGLPVVATVALSRGMLRMAKRKALVRRLHSVETLGSTSVICTDKTGTLTENKMTLTQIDAFDRQVRRGSDGTWKTEDNVVDLVTDSALERMLRVSVLCSNATVENGKCVGDPLETALLEAAIQFGVDVEPLRQTYLEEREVAFESESKMMATFHQKDNEIFVAVKGAPEAVLNASARVLTSEGEQELSGADRAALEETNLKLGEEGYRVLAVANRIANTVEEEPYQDLVWLGFLGLVDPPRTDIRSSIEECRNAGIRVVMVTGDQSATALHVAREVGIATESANAVPGSRLDEAKTIEGEEKETLLESSVFTRVSPRQKLDLITMHQDEGHVVAMTGDGVNDAPALKKADIGVAMGLRGTQVAREVADMVLKDDSFKTIVYAVREGRVIYGNIRKFVLYLLSCNIAEILVIFLAAFITSELPILPLQILFLNFVTDVFPAFALGAGEGYAGTMDRPPRSSQEAILTRRHWAEIIGYGAFISAATLIAFFVGRMYYEWSYAESVTIAFLTLALAQLWHVFNMREQDSSLFSNQVTRNPYVWGAIALCLMVLSVAVYVPPIAKVLQTTPISMGAWILVAACSIIPLILDRLTRLIYEVAPR